MCSSSPQSIAINALLSVLQAYPQFAQQGRNGQYSQQDAEECWTQLMSTLQDRLKVSSDNSELPAHEDRVRRPIAVDLSCDSLVGSDLLQQGYPCRPELHLQ